MATTVPIQTSFNGGKFGPLMKGRVDLQRYKYACEDLQNFIPTIQGPAVKRSGTRFVKHCISDGSASRAIPFEVSDEQAYVLEFGAGRIRMYRNSGAVLETADSFTAAPTATNPVVCTITAHGYVNGDSVYVSGSLMTQLNGRFFRVVVLTADTFELASENGVGRPTGLAGTAARHYDITDGLLSNSVPWADADLAAIKLVQNGDLLYMTHPDYPIHKLVRTNDTSWTCTEVVFGYPAFETENLTDTKLSIANNAAGASTTITATAAAFTSADVGRFITIADVMEADNGFWTGGGNFNEVNRDGTSLADGDQIYNQGRLYEVDGTPGSGGYFGFSPITHEEGTKSDGNVDLKFLNWGGYGYAEITGYTSSTVVSVTVVVAFSAGVISTPSKKWAFSAWDAVNGYPRAVAFYEDRLFFGGTDKEPQTFWGSRSGEFENFRLSPAAQADSGLQFSLLTEKLNTIEWMKGDEALIIGTTNGEFTADSGSASQGITPSNIRVRARSYYGTYSNIQPVTLDSSVVFVRRTREVHELTFDFDTNRYVAPDLTRFNDTALYPSAVEMSYQTDPFRQVWFLKSDGTFAALAYDKQEDVSAWADVAVNGFVESFTIIPHPDGDEDQVWMFVRRTINGVTSRHVDVLEKVFDEGDAQEDAFFVDGGSTYDGIPSTTITGLDHLNGEEVVILADGIRVPNQTVSAGQIVLDETASVVHAGLQMPSAKLRTLRWDQATREGTSQGLPGRITSVILRLSNTGNGIEYGGDFDSMSVWDRRTTSMPVNEAVPLFTGDTPFLDLNSGWEQEKRIAIRYDEPLPCTVVAVMGKMDAEVR